MIPFLYLAAAVLLIGSALAAIYRNRIPGALIWLANTAYILVNITPKGRGTKLAGPTEPFTERYLIASRDMADGEQYIVPYVAGTIPWAVIPDMTPAPTGTSEANPSDYPLPCNILGLNEDSERMIAGGAIAVDNLVAPAVGGRIIAIATAASGNYWVVGKANTATVNGAGDQVEVIPCFPYQATIA